MLLPPRRSRTGESSIPIAKARSESQAACNQSREGETVVSEQEDGWRVEGAAGPFLSAEQRISTVGGFFPRAGWPSGTSERAPSRDSAEWVIWLGVQKQGFGHVSKPRA